MNRSKIKVAQVDKLFCLWGVSKSKQQGNPALDDLRKERYRHLSGLSAAEIEHVQRKALEETKRHYRWLQVSEQESNAFVSDLLAKETSLAEEIRSEKTD